MLVTVTPRKRELPKNLTPAIGASGPHDFAVRFSHARQSQLWRPSLPDPRFVTNAHTPLWWDGMAIEVKLICLRDQLRFAATHWHDGQLSEMLSSAYFWLGGFFLPCPVGEWPRLTSSCAELTRHPEVRASWRASKDDGRIAGSGGYRVIARSAATKQYSLFPCPALLRSSPRR